MLANISITGSSSLSEGATDAMGTIGAPVAFLIGIVLAIFILETLIGVVGMRQKNND